MSKKAVNVLLLTISQGVNIVLTFLFTPYLVRVLDKNIFGSYSQTVLLADLTSLLTSVAIIQIAMMFFSNVEKKIEDIIKTILIFTISGGVLGFVLFYIFSYLAPHFFDNDLLSMYMKVFAISILGNKLNLVLNQAMIRVEQTKYLVKLSILTNFVKLTLALVAIKYFNSILLFLFVYSLEPIVSSAIQLLKLYKLNYLNGRFDKQIVHEVFHIGLPLYVVEILGNSYTYIAGFIISINLNEEQFAIYRNGSFELPIIGTIYVTISTIFMSDMSIKIQQKSYESVAAMKKKIITTTAVILFPVAIFTIFFSREFILLYMSEKYIESYKVLIIFSIALLIRFQNYTDVLVLLKKSKYVLLSFIVFMISNVSLNLILSKYYGILGCAVATVFSVYILAFMQLHIVIRELKVTYNDYIDIPKLLKILLASILFTGGVKLALYYLHSNILFTFLIGGMITIPSLVLYFIKKRYIEIELYKSIFLKIPIFGDIIYSFLQANDN